MAQKILGLSQEQLLGKTAVDPAWHFLREDGTVAPPDDYPVSRVLASRKALKNYILGVHRPNQESDVWVLVNADPVFGKEDELTQIIVTFIDISERKRVEDALSFVAQRGWQTSGENFFDALAQFLGEKLDMDYVLIDRLDENQDMAETVALYAKGAITPNMRYALKGTPCENVMGRRLCVYPSGIQQLFPEDTLLPGMGAESYIGIPLWDSTGQPVGLIAVMGNKPLPDDAPVTQLLQLVATRAAAELERERSNRVLRAREHEFRTLAANLPDNVVRYDLEGRTVYVNPVLEETLGDDAARMLGMRIREYLPDGSYEAYAQAVDAALASGKNGEIEWTLPVPSKEPIVHHIRMIVERDEQGEVSGLLAIGRDITELKRAEQALQERERHSQSLLHLSRNLEHSQTYAEVLHAAQGEVATLIGYQNLWVYLLSEDKAHLKALVASGPESGVVMSEEGTATLTIAGDKMLEEIAQAKEIVLVEDARTDPRVNQEIVARLDLRTIVNVPIVLSGRHLGTVGVGTFGAEGVRIPSASEQRYLSALASHL
ncbi:MAG: PAS domain-containing protein, partial [Lacisediminimonas sp.]|nr:PAS domain-containing protein [Lacisediminimonas sp.]